MEARRREAAQLVIVGTYRRGEAVTHAHSVCRVTQELQVHGQSVELALGCLSAGEVTGYLSQRFTASALPQRLARLLHRRTEGNPMFLVAMVDELVRQGLLREETAGWSLAGDMAAAVVGVPESLRKLVDQQLERLSPAEQEILEAASVAGKEFAAAAVAAEVEQAAEEVETRCATLSRRGQFVHTQGVADWPDGTVTMRYTFRHDLYRETIYARVPTNQRVRWHRQIGLRLETGYGLRVREIAAELAEHFTRGRDTARAVRYLQHAGMNALHRHAHQEAIEHLTRGLEALHTLPETSERMQDELGIQIALGSALVVTHGYATPAVEEVYTRAYALSRQLDDLSRLLPILWGLVEVSNVRKEFYKARELGEQYLTMAQRREDAGLLVDAYYVLGLTLFYLSELPAARAFRAGTGAL
jgi:predicted ATPase